MKKRIATIIGTRPQFIKAATLSRLFQNHERLEEILIHTGQHYDQKMSEIFFEELQIPNPKYSLNIHGGSHGQMTGRMLGAIDDLLIKEKPDVVLVYGDTNSTLAGALSASKLHIPVVHVEAGLRSHNRFMPEEINRILTDHLSSLLLCPTTKSLHNLKLEGLTSNVHHVGDVMYDATLHALNIIKDSKKLERKFDFLPNQFMLLTIHREESSSSLKIFEEILDYSIQFSAERNLPIIFPAHPRVKTLIEKLSQDRVSHIIFIEPVSYFETQFLLTRASYVLTDSGGLQKESYFHRVPCITLRSETEWVETLESGWNQLWQNKIDSTPLRKTINDYGTGRASEEIVKIIDQVSS